MHINLSLNIDDKEKFTDFFLIDIKTSRLLHFEDYVYLKQIYEHQLPNDFQTKLHKRHYTPHICSHFPRLPSVHPLPNFFKKAWKCF